MQGDQHHLGPVSRNTRLVVPDLEPCLRDKKHGADGMVWERARTEAQKTHRISEIIDATARLYQTHRFEDITFVSIAKEAKFTRSNLYKYFNTKEEIFFEFLKHDIRLWRQDLETAFQKKKSVSIEDFASIWLKVQVAHGRMLNLISLLYAFLEKNCSMASLVDFKRMVKAEIQILSQLLCDLFPELTQGKAFQFLNLQLAASIGLYTMTNLSDVQEEVLSYPEFENFKLDYNAYFKAAVEFLLKGLLP